MWHVRQRVKVYPGFWWGNMKERDQLKDLGLQRKDNIITDLQEVGCGGMDWIDPAQDRDRTVVTAVMNLLVPQNVENLLTI
jgi:hypothetical protein